MIQTQQPYDEWIQNMDRLEKEATDNEIWKDIPNCPNYQASDFGQIRSKMRRGHFKPENKINNKWRILKTNKRKSNGRVTVSLPKFNGEKGYQHIQVSVIIAMTFIGPRPYKMDVAHLNGNPADNRLSNLAYCSRKENESHKIIHGTAPRGERNSQSILKDWMIDEIRFLASKGISYGRIASLFNVTHGQIGPIVDRKTWAHVTTRLDIPRALEELRKRDRAIEFLLKELKETYGSDWYGKIEEVLK